VTPERWAQIEELFHRVADCDPECRAELLDGACNGDAELRRSVELLLASEDSGRDDIRAAVQSGVETVSFPLLGETVTHYRIVAGLRGGGMGIVYRAEDMKLGRQVALKFLPEESANDPAALGRFEREARSASALEHLNICPIYEFGEHEGKPFLVMQLLEGRTLRDLLSDTDRAKRLLELPQLLDLALQIIEGLDAAHRHGIIHRDIKPENLFITKDDCVKILDFGLAKLARLEKDSTETLATLGLQTHPGTIAGTVGYMSPEQVKGENLDAQTDLFSFGVVLYEMVTGKRPFDEATLGATFEAILSRQPVAPTRLNSHTPLELERIISKALEKHREVRYQNAREIRADLKRLKRDTESGHTSTAEAASEKKGKPLPWLVAITAGLLTATLAVLFFYRAYNHFDSGSGAAFNSVAVLPFANAMENPNTEYLSDGITETLIASLSRLPNVFVRPSSSVVRYTAKEADLQKVASELEVGAVVTGQVRQRGDSVVISVELIDTHRNRILWSEQYENRLSDILIVQKDITREIAARVANSLTTEQRTKLSEYGTTDPEAYQLYLKGRYQWGKRTGESLRKAKDFYQQAIRKDPNYALAYVGLAEYFLALPGYTDASVRSTNPDVKANALRALAIDESQAQAHAVLATAYDNEWDPAAVREYERALELNPNDGRIHVLYGIYSYIHGNQEQAFMHLHRALELDPLDLNASENLAYNYCYSRQYERAIEQVESVLELEPNRASTHGVLSNIYRSMGKYRLWLDEWEKSARLNNDAEDLELVRAVRMEYFKSGLRPATNLLIALRKEQSNRIYVDPGEIALAYAMLGDKEQTFIWLEKAFADKSSVLSYIKSEPEYDFLRSDPRYAKLLRRMNLL
jgi:TolB-like protein/Tfp pilus assembly protein PilF/predicted Ser/Thr protein kinase